MDGKALAWGLAALLCGGVLLAVPAARAQSEDLGPTTSDQGPTREATSATVRGHLDEASTAPRIMPGYLAFQRDFARDFGTPPHVTDRLDGLLGLEARLEARWGKTTLYQWIERCLALYARVQASTRMEKKGFDIRVGAADVAGGKLGIHMTRALGSAASAE